MVRMAKSIQNSIKCKICSMIYFLCATDEHPGDIHHQIIFVYGNMNRQNVLKMCHAFSESRANVHKEHRIGRPSMISDALLCVIGNCLACQV